MGHSKTSEAHYNATYLTAYLQVHWQTSRTRRSQNIPLRQLETLASGTRGSIAVNFQVEVAHQSQAPRPKATEAKLKPSDLGLRRSHFLQAVARMALIKVLNMELTTITGSEAHLHQASRGTSARSKLIKVPPDYYNDLCKNNDQWDLEERMDVTVQWDLEERTDVTVNMSYG
ncbi:hypothetical protein DFP72DRAFT_839165 [Ephemerocybe angulata]|uniref:Uncharacterized protein n=1 Tax=Ephemerocybe angulata TaxID=980116 RepID=A0A8H6IIX9_9AGAR|nr:hypothetical protein DFP72DRAFT_839165 [Tulosesus angulatus]